MKLTKLQNETLLFCKKQIDEARKQVVNIKNAKKKDLKAI